MKKTIFNPKVSIIIPVFNGSDYVSEAIESALTQTYENIEVIVVNDGSRDDGRTEQVVALFGDKIKYYYKENGGVSSALNYGIEKMTGDYFSWLSHDDKYTPYKIEHLVRLLENCNSDRTIALSGLMYINNKSEIIKNVNYSFESNKIYSGVDTIKYMLKNGVLNGCALLIPKMAFIECGGFNEDLRYNQDALMWYQIFANDYNLVVDNKNRDVMYRLHVQQASKTRRDLLLRDSYEMSKIVVPIFLKYTSKQENLLKEYAKRYARHDCLKAVEYCIEEGKKEGVLTRFDSIELKGWLLWGKCRNILKIIYQELLLR